MTDYENLLAIEQKKLDDELARLDTDMKKVLTPESLEDRKRIARDMFEHSKRSLDRLFDPAG